MRDLPKGFDLGRLCDAVQVSREGLRPFREQRVESVRQAAGSHWGEQISRKDVPINVIDQYERVVGKSLIAKEPRVMLSTHDPRQGPAVAACEDWVNAELVRMRFADTVQRITYDALHCVGIAKVAIATPAGAAVKAWGLKGGQPYIDRVDLDDFVYDLYARDFAEVAFMGHRLRCPLDVAQAMYRRAKLTASRQADTNAEGDDRIGTLGRAAGGGGGTLKGEMDDMIDLWEIYLPRHRLVVTLQDDQTGGRPLAADPLSVAPWVGPDDGPYLVLGFGLVSGSAMPKAPIQNLLDLHLFLNRGMRKIIRQTDRLKVTVPVKGGALDDGAKLKQTADGEIWECENADTIKEFKTGGPDPVLDQVITNTHGLVDRMAGNLSLLSGSAPQSKTAKQDEMLNQNSSRSITDMQGTAVCFTAEGVRRLMWFWWHHPQKVMKAPLAAPGVPEISTMRRVYPAGPRARGKSLRRNGPVPETRVDPYSVVYQTPQGRLQFINGVVTQLTPMMPLLQQNGVVFDANAYLDVIAKYGDEPEIRNIFKFQPPPASSDGGEDSPGLLGGTNAGPNGGEYVRRSVGMASPAAQQAQARTDMQAAVSQQQGASQ